MLTIHLPPGIGDGRCATIRCFLKECEELARKQNEYLLSIREDRSVCAFLPSSNIPIHLRRRYNGMVCRLTNHDRFCHENSTYSFQATNLCRSSGVKGVTGALSPLSSVLCLYFSTASTYRKWSKSSSVSSPFRAAVTKERSAWCHNKKFTASG